MHLDDDRSFSTGKSKLKLQPNGCDLHHDGVAAEAASPIPWLLQILSLQSHSGLDRSWPAADGCSKRKTEQDM